MVLVVKQGRSSCLLELFFFFIIIVVISSFVCGWTMIIFLYSSFFGLDAKWRFYWEEMTKSLRLLLSTLVDTKFLSMALRQLLETMACNRTSDLPFLYQAI